MNTGSCKNSTGASHISRAGLGHLPIDRRRVPSSTVSTSTLVHLESNMFDEQCWHLCTIWHIYWYTVCAIWLFLHYLNSFALFHHWVLKMLVSMPTMSNQHVSACLRWTYGPEVVVSQNITKYDTPWHRRTRGLCQCLPMSANGQTVMAHKIDPQNWRDAVRQKTFGIRYLQGHHDEHRLWYILTRWYGHANILHSYALKI